MELSNQRVIFLSRCLLVSFITTVTLWYFISPYMVRSHPKFVKDMKQLISQHSEAPGEVEWVENWTKWQLYLGDGENKVTVYPFTQMSIANMSFPVQGQFEWRSEYRMEIHRTGDMQLNVVSAHPWYGNMGLYNHYHSEVENLTVRLLPNFMFGVPQYILDQLYGGPEGIPTIGMVTSSPGSDRVVVQCYMNLVILAVIFLLWANNPTHKKQN